MELTRENYYKAEANQEFLSCSAYDSYMECEAAALAKERGRFRPKASKAFVLGNYFHTYFESQEAHDEFIKDHAEDLFTKTSITPKVLKSGIVKIPTPVKLADTKKIDTMIRTVMNDDLMRRFIEMPGENEKIMTGTLFGVPWKMRMDKVVPGIIIDYKTCASIWETSYDPEQQRRVTFVEKYGYTKRAAVYREIYKQNMGEYPLFLLLCVSKEDPPDKEPILVSNEQVLQYELSKIQDRTPRIQRIRDGSIKPLRCGTCEYCRLTKQCRSIKTHTEIDPEFRQREEEYDELWLSSEVVADVSEQAGDDDMPDLSGGPEMEV